MFLLSICAKITLTQCNFFPSESRTCLSVTSFEVERTILIVGRKRAISDESFAAATSESREVHVEVKTAFPCFRPKMPPQIYSDVRAGIISMRLHSKLQFLAKLNNAFSWENV